MAETIQRNRPDVVLLNEFDYVADGSAVDLFRTNYLQVAHNGAAAIDYPLRVHRPPGEHRRPDRLRPEPQRVHHRRR